MFAVLTTLRTLIAIGVSLLVWLVVQSSSTPDSLLGVLLPVWVAGAAGGLVCSLFSPSMGILMAFTAGVTLTLGFYWYELVFLARPPNPNTLIATWPLWFPAAFYVGAFGGYRLWVKIRS